LARNIILLKGKLLKNRAELELHRCTLAVPSAMLATALADVEYHVCICLGNGKLPSRSLELLFFGTNK